MKLRDSKFLTFLLAAVSGTVCVDTDCAAQRAPERMPERFTQKITQNKLIASNSDSNGVTKMDDIDDILGTKGSSHKGSSRKNSPSKDISIDDILKMSPGTTKSNSKKSKSTPSKTQSSDDFIKAVEEASARASKPSAADSKKTPTSPSKPATANQAKPGTGSSTPPVTGSSTTPVTGSSTKPATGNSTKPVTADSTKGKPTGEGRSERTAAQKHGSDQATATSKLVTPGATTAHKPVATISAQEQAKAKLRQFVAPPVNLPNPMSLNLDQAAAQGVKCTQAKQYKESIPFYTRALSLAPTNEKILRNRAVAYDCCGQFNDALNDFDRSLALKFDQSVFFSKVDTLIHANRIPQALAECDSLIQRDPNDVALVRRKAEVLIKVGDPSSAVALLTSIIGSHPDDAKTYALRTSAYYQLRMPDEAMADVIKELQLVGETADVLADRGDIEGFLLNDYDRGMADFAEALRRDPKNKHALSSRCALAPSRTELVKYRNDIDTLLTIDPYNAFAWALLGSYTVAIGQPDLALEYYARARQLDPTERTGYMMPIALLGDRNQYAAALAMSDDSIRHCPHDGPVYSMRARVESAHEEYAKAIEDANNAIRIEPRYMSPYAVRAKALFYSGKPTEAISSLEEADKNGVVDHWGDLSECRIIALIKLDQLDQALTEANLAVPKFPKNDNLLWQRSRIAQKQNRSADAIADVEAGFKLNPKSSSYPGRLGDLYLAQKDYDTARRYYKVQSELDPKSSEGYYNVARSYSNQKNYKEAIVWYTKALTIEPDDQYNNYYYGVNQQRLGNYKAALSAFARIAKPNSTRDENFQRKALAEACLGLTVEALKDANTAIKLKDSTYNYCTKAYIEDALDQSQNALNDAERMLSPKILESSPEQVSMAKVMVALFSLQLHQDQKFKSMTESPAPSAEWPYPVLDWLGGRLTLAEIESKADTPAKQSDLKTYVGIRNLSEGNAAQAIENFRWVSAHGDNASFEKAFVECWLHQHTPKATSAPQSTSVSKPGPKAK